MQYGKVLSILSTTSSFIKKITYYRLKLLEWGRIQIQEINQDVTGSEWTASNNIWPLLLSPRMGILGDDFALLTVNLESVYLFIIVLGMHFYKSQTRRRPKTWKIPSST
jgi:hypothetical protein